MNHFLILLLLLFPFIGTAQSLEQCIQDCGQYMNNGDYKAMEISAKKAVELGEKQFGTKGDEMGVIYSLYAMALENRSKLDSAQIYFQKSFDILKKNPNDYPELMAVVKLKLKMPPINNPNDPIQKLDSKDKYEIAIDFLSRVVETAKKLEDTTYIHAMQGLASVYMQGENYLKSKILYTQAAEYTEKLKGKNNHVYASILQDIGELNVRIGNYTKAYSLYQEVLAFQQIDSSKHPILYAKTLGNLGFLYETTSNYETAARYYIHERDIRKRELDKMQKDTASERYRIEFSDYNKAIHKLDALYIHAGKYDLATNFKQEVSKLLQNETLPKDFKNGELLYNMGQIYKSAGKYAEAKALYQKSAEIYKKRFGEKDVDYAIVLEHLAGIYANEGKYSESEKLCAESQSILGKKLGKNHYNYLTVTSVLAHLYKLMGKPEKVEKAYKEANDGYFLHYKKNSFHLDEQEKERYWKTMSDNIELLYDFTQSRIPKNPTLTIDAYENRLRTHSILLNSSLQMQNALYKSGDTALIRLFDRYHLAKFSYSKAMEMSEEERKKQGINLRERGIRLNEMEKQLSLRSQPFREATDTLGIKWTQIRDKLGENEAAIEIVRFRRFNTNWTDTVSYAAMIINHKTKEHPIWISLGDGNKMEKQGYKRYLAAIESGQSTKESYELYWAKIDSALGKTEKVYISVEGIYHKLSLAALQNKKGEYLGNKGNIHIVYSTGDLLRKQKNSQNRPKIAELYGRPSYMYADVVENKEGIERERANEFEDLPASEEEVKKIDSLLQNAGYKVDVYLKEKATENQVKQVQNPTILHIATHSYRDTTFYPNVLMRYGLSLAGAKYHLWNEADTSDIRDFDKKENGILTAYEASALNLYQTDLVVLSACATALGDIDYGEGVYGLQRAFRIAGANAIIVSLWDVNSTSTAFLMKAFYKNYVQGQGKFESLRQAQIETQKVYPSAKKWAGFVLIGE